MKLKPEIVKALDGHSVRAMTNGALTPHEFTGIVSTGWADEVVPGEPMQGVDYMIVTTFPLNGPNGTASDTPDETSIQHWIPLSRIRGIEVVFDG